MMARCSGLSVAEGSGLPSKAAKGLEIGLGGCGVGCGVCRRRQRRRAGDRAGTPGGCAAGCCAAGRGFGSGTPWANAGAARQTTNAALAAIRPVSRAILQFHSRSPPRAPHASQHHMGRCGYFATPPSGLVADNAILNTVNAGGRRQKRSGPSSGIRISRFPAWLGWPTTPSCSMRSMMVAARL